MAEGTEAHSQGEEKGEEMSGDRFGVMACCGAPLVAGGSHLPWCIYYKREVKKLTALFKKWSGEYKKRKGRK